MVEEKNIKSDSVKTTKPVQTKAVKTSSLSKLSSLSLVVSAASLGVAGYMFVSTTNDIRNISNVNQTYSTLQGELDKLKTNQNLQKSIASKVETHSNAQRSVIKIIQFQLDILNTQLTTPTKDMYLQMSIASIQSAIDYLILAKRCGII